MSASPVRRFSTASPTNHLKREESLINAYEAEEERIINVLSRKLEQVRFVFLFFPPLAFPLLFVPLSLLFLDAGF